MVTELENNIISGLILVVLVLLLFLGFTNSLFVAVAIPFSMLITFIVLRAMDVTLNMVVLFSLILALGMLVDNAIVIVENIFRHRSKGKKATPPRATARPRCRARWWPRPDDAVRLRPHAAVAGHHGRVHEVPAADGDDHPHCLVAGGADLHPVLCSRFMRLPRKSETKDGVGDRLIGFGLRPTGRRWPGPWPTR